MLRFSLPVMAYEVENLGDIWLTGLAIEDE
jgi:hypothetical protein